MVAEALILTNPALNFFALQRKDFLGKEEAAKSVSKLGFKKKLGSAWDTSCATIACTTITATVATAYSCMLLDLSQFHLLVAPLEMSALTL